MSTNIFHDGLLIDVDVRFWSAAISLEAKDLGLEEKDIADSFKLGKKMLIPHEVIKAFRTVEGQARYVVESNSFKFPIGNAYFVPRKRFSKVLDKLKECQEAYGKLLDDLVIQYEAYRQQMIPVYQEAAQTAFINQLPQTTTFGPDYDQDADKAEFTKTFLDRIQAHYPSVETLRERFSLTWNVYEIAVPRMRKADEGKVVEDEEMRKLAEQDYRSQIHTKINGFVSEVVSVLRTETVDLCSKIMTNIEDGKVIRSKTITSLRGFIDRFSDLNFVGDVQVEQQLETIRKELLDKYPSEQFSEDMNLQGELKRKLGELVETATKTDINSVTGEYRRKIQWQ